MADNTTETFINLEKVNCPKCGEEQPILRTPESLDQAILGGYTCQKCNTKIDRHGKEIVG